MILRHADVVRSAVVLGGAIVMAAGCAGVAEVTGTASQQDLLQIRSDISVLQANLQRTRTEVEKQSKEIETHTRTESAQTRERLDDLGRRVEALSTTLTALTGRIDEISGRLETVSRRLESAAAPSAAPPRGQPSAPPPPSAPARTPGGVQPQDIYQTAYIDFSKGSYALAIAGFLEFLRRYPDHELAGSAQYWIGEAHFSLARGQAGSNQADKAAQELERAVQEFRKVLANYPRSDKAPTALYKEALALIELKQPGQAQNRLQYLIETFPQAEEAPLARERLGALKGS